MRKLLLTPRAISAGQVRAARRLLGWTVNELAHRASVGNFTVDQIEGLAGPYPGLAAIQTTLEAAGIEFINDAPGVRLHPKRRNEPERPIGSRHERSTNKIG